MDLTTTYLGLSLKNPIVPSASPLSETVDSIRRLEDAGAAAVVMFSLFEEQIISASRELDHFLSYGTESYAESLTFFPDLGDYKTGPEEYLNLISEAKSAVGIPIIGSLNGVSTGGWIEHAQKIQEAGADALELNIYYIPTSTHITGHTVEQMYLDVVRDVCASVKIPVAVKLSPFFSATGNMILRLAEAGAKGFALFNRFYQPDFDLEALEVVPSLVFSHSFDMRVALRWVAILYGQVEADFAITNGVHTYEDVLKGLMAGANVTMMAAELLTNGVGRIGEILDEMSRWMEEHEYESVAQMRGSMSMRHIGDPAAFERANYMKALQSWRPDPSGQGFQRRVKG